MIWQEEAVSYEQRAKRSIRQFCRSFLLSLLALLSTCFGLGQATPYLSNASTCDQCHSMPTKFGSSPLTVQRVGSLSAGNFVPGPEGGIRHRIRDVPSSVRNAKQIAGERVALSLLGDGYIEALDDHDLHRNASEQRRSKSGIVGQLVAAPVLESRSSKPRTQAGRFGWKSQHSSLMSACADSLRNELGIRNQLYTDEYADHKATDPATPFDTRDPKTRTTELERMVEEIRRTAPPAPDDQLAESSDAKTGGRLFAQIGCALCHVATYKTLPTGTPINGGTYRVPAALGGTTIHPYSDFLLHDVGAGDGIPQAARPEYLDQSTANKFRTAPLWGVRFRSWMMHDGKSITYHQAIMRHGGEATRVRERYETLTPIEKQHLRAFLNSL
jgi:CxxC motif-containing protein (DUF1111 family)